MSGPWIAWKEECFTSCFVVVPSQCEGLRLSGYTVVPASLASKAPEMRAMLESLEWCKGLTGTCPVCGCHDNETLGQHLKGCRLKRLLEEAK